MYAALVEKSEALAFHGDIHVSSSGFLSLITEDQYPLHQIPVFPNFSSFYKVRAPKALIFVFRFVFLRSRVLGF